VRACANERAAAVGFIRWNIGLWGTQGAQDARCNYQLTVHKDAADALTFGSLFSDTVEGAAPNYYSFALTGTPLTTFFYANYIQDIFQKMFY
jgi:hypothetical protein